MDSKHLTIILALGLAAVVAQKERKKSQENFAVLSFNRGEELKYQSLPIITVEEFDKFFSTIPRSHEITAGAIYVALDAVAERQIADIGNIPDNVERQKASEKLLSNLIDFGARLASSYDVNLCKQVIAQQPTQNADDPIELRTFYRNVLLKVSDKNSFDELLSRLVETKCLTPEASEGLKKEWASPTQQVLRKESVKTVGENWAEYMAAKQEAYTKASRVPC